MKSDQKKIESFLSDLAGLAASHGIIVVGCGCCGSPFLMKKEKDGHYSIRHVQRPSEETWEDLRWKNSSSDLPEILDEQRDV